MLRTHFGDEAAWDALRSAIDGVGDFSPTTYVSDRRFAGADVRFLVDAAPAAEDDDWFNHPFIADATSRTCTSRSTPEPLMHQGPSAASARTDNSASGAGSGER